MSHAIHARHLDIQDGKIGWTRLETVKRRETIGISHDSKSPGFKGYRNGRQDIAVIVDESDGWHRCLHERIAPPPAGILIPSSQGGGTVK
jgi:hypothetical protein